MYVFRYVLTLECGDWREGRKGKMEEIEKKEGRTDGRKRGWEGNLPEC
jgi:hypothetical protein